jgi:hypothetical protein
MFGSPASSTAVLVVGIVADGIAGAALLSVEDITSPVTGSILTGAGTLVFLLTDGSKSKLKSFSWSLF